MPLFEFYGNLFLQDQILVKVDRLSMMHSLEVRTPLLDIDLVNCVRKIPNSLKLKGNQTKYILKKTMESLLPHDIIWRKKVGFSAPLGKWLSQKLIEYQPGDSWSPEAQKLMTHRLDTHMSLKADNRLFLWNTYILNEFLKYHPSAESLVLPENEKSMA